MNLAVALITVEFERCSDAEHERLEDQNEDHSPAYVWLAGLYTRVWKQSARKRQSVHAPSNWPLFQQIRKSFHGFINAKPVAITFNVLILLNVVMMATEFYGMPTLWENVIEFANIAFIIIFTIELIIRFVAMELSRFLHSPLMLIDVMIVIFSWIDLSLESVNAPIVRAIRALRLLNLFKSFPVMYRWLMIIFRSLQSSLLLCVMIALTLFMFACLGMQLFGGSFCGQIDVSELLDDTRTNCTRPRTNFDTFGIGFLTSFIIMTGDGWDDVMITAMRAKGDIYALFFVFLYVLSNYVLLSLLIGIFLNVRTEEEREEARKKHRLVVDEEEEAKKEEAKRIGVRIPTEFQQSLRRFLAHKATETFILIVILLSSLCLALESPFEAPDTTTGEILNVSDFMFNLVFYFEVIVSWMAFGLFWTPDSYLRRDIWNVFDFVLVAMTFAGEMLTTFGNKSGGSTASALRAVRVMRAVRPFRFVRRFEGLRVVVSALVKSVAPLRNLIFVFFCVFTLWGIMGVQMFKGSFYSCSDGSDANEKDCGLKGRDWINAEFHFDNLVAAYMTLFEMATQEGWSGLMFKGIDAQGPGLPPKTNNNAFLAIYFISFVIVGSFFFMNLLVSIIIDAYQKEKTSSSRGSRFLTPSQNAWMRSHRCILSVIPVVDYDEDETTSHKATAFIRIRHHLRAFVRHAMFDVAVYCCIVLNFLVMAVDRYPKSDLMTTFVTASNTTFTILFVIEAALKLIAESPKRYFQSKWNMFDFILVSLSLAATVLEIASGGSTFVATFRSMRVLRLLRMIRKSRRLQVVLKRFLFALYSLNNVAAVLILLFFCFGVMGMKLFGRVKRTNVLTHNANFSSLGQAMLLLLRISTGGDWDVLVSACGMSSGCDSNLDECGLPIVAQLYFVIFLVLGMFILLNLFVAVILDAFASAGMDEEFLSPFEAQQFFRLWLHFDPERTYRMQSKYLLTLLRAIPEQCPLGFGILPERRRLQYELVFVDALLLKERDGMIELEDLVYALCRKAYRDNDLPETKRRKLVAKADCRFRKEERERFVPQIVALNNVVDRLAVMILEAYWIQRKERLRMRQFFAEQRRIRTGEAARQDAQRMLYESKSLLMASLGTQPSETTLSRTRSMINFAAGALKRSQAGPRRRRASPPQHPFQAPGPQTQISAPPSTTGGTTTPVPETDMATEQTPSHSSTNNSFALSELSTLAMSSLLPVPGGEAAKTPPAEASQQPLSDDMQIL